ncbi:MAG: endolytic transglycosylase MltG [Bryobacterales bacterium]|nr:endolytic transglycosylase MltG [Bryobacterales bacterium]
MKRMKRMLGFLLLLVLAVSAGGIYVLRQLSAPFQGFGEEAVFVEVERGMSTAQIAEALAAKGVIASAWQLQVARLLPPRALLQAGEYRFAKPASALEVTDRLRRGDVYFVTLKVPEGLNLWEMAQLVESSDLQKATGFLKEARNPELIKDLAPSAESLEGYLFPSTYEFRRNTTAREICERLTREFRQQWQALGHPGDVHEVVTMASLVEKESSLTEERPLVASVFWNRQREGIKLDCDPTVIYAALLEGRYRGTIYLSDLQREHPYNTYQRRGLPPGPIANPGLEALRAAIHPAQSDYLFFVAKGDGSGAHRFSENLAAHSRAVQAYRDALKAPNANRNDSGNR